MSLGCATILIVDDEPSNIKVAGAIIKELGDIKIVVATNGEDAIKIVNSKIDIDLVLLDIMMPDMSGYEVCAKLKADKTTEEIPVIFMSALDDESSEEKGLSLGALDYIKKPFSIPITKARIKNYLTFKAYQDELKMATLIDSMTGLANRRSFEGVYKRECIRAKRYAGKISCLMIDIDSFKKYNDNYGHVEGDVCIKKVATAIKDSLSREIDFCARYGGEEFVVLLPDCDSNVAESISTRIIENVRKLSIEHAYSDVAESNVVTVSIGFAALLGAEIENHANLVELADEALYRAKRNGRNRAES